jgi:hypothetical protein
MVRRLDAEYVLGLMREQDTNPIKVCEDMGINPKTMGLWLVGLTEPREITLRALARFLKVKDKNDLLLAED